VMNKRAEDEITGLGGTPGTKGKPKDPPKKPAPKK